MAISNTALQEVLTRIKSYVDSHSSGASNFSDLNDVSLSNVQNGQIPKYNSTTQKWENANESAGATYTAGDGIDITNNVISTVQKLIRITQANFDALPLVEKNDVNKFYYIVDSEEFEGVNDLVDLHDVNISNIQDKQVIMWDATSQKFINATIQSGGASNFADLDDVNVAGITDGSVIYFDATSATYKPKILNWSDISNKPFSTIGDGLSVVNDTLKADFSYILTDTEPSTITDGTIVFVYE